MGSDQLNDIWFCKWESSVFLWSNGSNIKASAVMRYALSIYNGRMEVT